MSPLDSYDWELDYMHVREIPGLGKCGLRRMIFTVGLCVGLDESGYVGRYCYKSWAEAYKALDSWDGIGDPPGEWIKYKGADGDRPRIIENYEMDTDY